MTFIDDKRVKQHLNLLFIVFFVALLVPPCLSACNAACATCNGTTAHDCLSCANPTFYLRQNGTCGANCPLGTFKNNMTMTCDNCTASCRSCDGPSSTDCLTCSSPLFLNPDGSCQLTCPAVGYWPNANTSKCVACASSCYTCNASGATGCTSCNGTRALNPDGSCKTTCPNGTYKAGNLCLNCSASCGTCNGTATNCTSCPGTNYFFNATAHTCTLCHASCATCSGAGPTACLTCANSTPFFVPGNSSCVAACPNGTFDNGNSTCAGCDASCATCNGSSNTSCTACNGSNFLNPDGSCKTTCPNGTFGNSSSHMCQNCSASCGTCVGIASNCTSCPGTNWFFNATAHTCTLCHASCATCSGAGPTACLTCANSTPFFIPGNSSCVAACPNGTFDNGNNTCVNCSASCATCNGSSNTSCTSCNGSNFLNPDGSCKTTCPNGTFGNSSAHACQNCSASCGTCVGTAPNCTSCPGTNWFFNATAHTCTLCDPSCATCSGAGPTACLTCANSTPIFISANNSCVASCPNGTFYSGNGTCSPCNNTCNTCNGPTNRNCTSCRGARFLNPDGACRTTCPNGTVANSTTHTCVGSATGCFVTCAGCSGPGADQCTSCSTDYPIIVGNSCYVQCNGTYSGKQFICNSCDPSCNGCNYATVNCISCASGYTRNGTTGPCQPIRRRRMRNV